MGGVITRFFEALKSHVDVSRYRVNLSPDADYLPLDQLRNAVVVAELPEKYILKVWLGSPTVAELQYQTECADPLSIEAVHALGITHAYIGVTESDVIARYPELEGDNVSYAEEFNVILTPKITKVE